MQVLYCFTLCLYVFGKFRKNFGKLWEMLWKFPDFFGSSWKPDFFGSSWKNSEMLGIGFWIDQRFEVLVDFFAD